MQLSESVGDLGVMCALKKVKQNQRDWLKSDVQLSPGTFFGFCFSTVL